MNIAFFLLPKKEVAYLHSGSTIRQALEKMEYHRYSAIPVIDRKGRYVKTITEGDLLWGMKKKKGFNFENSHLFFIDDIQVSREIKGVHIDAEMEDLLNLAIDQNFIPITDDDEIFIGIVRRREIIEYVKRSVLIKGREMILKVDSGYR